MRGRLLLVLLLTSPVVELAVIIQAGRRFGVLPVILAIVASTVLGLAVLRRAGRRALSDLTAARDQWASGLRTPPLPGAGDRALVGLAGVLLLLPGLVGSLVGLVLLIPPARTLVRALTRRSGQRAVQRRGTGSPTVRVISVDSVEPVEPTDRGPGTPPPAIEGTVIDSRTEPVPPRRAHPGEPPAGPADPP